MPCLRRQDDLVAGLRHGDADERVALVEADADDAALLGPAVILERRLLDDAASRRHQQVFAVLEPANRDDAGDLLLLA